MKVRTVRLEIIREGTQYGYLLTPLARYLAICGNHEPEVLQVPFHHHVFMQRIRALNVKDGTPSVEQEDLELATELRRMLEGLNCLRATLAEADRDGVDLVALELVLSASELALLPFELVWKPGVPTRSIAGCNVAIIRGTRSVPSTLIQWPLRPNILLAASSASGGRPVPSADHEAVIRAALMPWCDFASGAALQAELKKYLTVINNASLQSIASALRSAPHGRPFTHIHLLAHGRAYGPLEAKFGLVFDDSTKPSGRNRGDVVDGTRLASALTGAGDHPPPVVVTIAGCHSGSVGDVSLPGTSIAWDLHNQGIPWIVASQFPLTYEGSTIFAKRLYESLLWVDDPRVALGWARSALHAECASDTDWASVVSYGALPEDVEADVEAARIKQLRRALDAAVAHADAYVVPQGDPGRCPDALGRVETLLTNRSPDLNDHLEMTWFLGSIYKRLGQNAAGRPFADRGLRTPLPTDTSLARELFERSMQAYRKAYIETSEPSALAQYLSLQAFRGDELDRPMWHLALRQTELLMSAQHSPERMMELERTRLELTVQRPLVKDPVVDDRFGVVIDDMRRWLRDRPSTTFELYSMLRQLQTYARWCSDEAVVHRAEHLAQILSAGRVTSRWTATVDWRRSASGYELVMS